MVTGAECLGDAGRDGPQPQTAQIRGKGTACAIITGFTATAPRRISR